jgi:hypothetical protein
MRHHHAAAAAKETLRMPNDPSDSLRAQVEMMRARARQMLKHRCDKQDQR